MPNILKLRMVLILSLIAVTGSYGSRENRPDMLNPPPASSRIYFPDELHSPVEPRQFDIPARTILRRLEAIPNEIRDRAIPTSIPITNQDERIHFMDEFEKRRDDKPAVKHITEKLNDKPQAKDITKQLGDKGITEKLDDKPQAKDITKQLGDKPQAKGITEKLDDEPQAKDITEKLNDYPKTEKVNEDNIDNNEIDEVTTYMDSTTEFTTAEDYESTTLDDLSGRAGVPGAVLASLLGG